MDVDQFKQAQSFVWGLGDYSSFARLLDGAAKLTVERAGVSEGERVLDVATGTGNGALWAARAGAKVTGLDLSPALLETARARAQEAGLEIEFVQGDAEALPFADGEFDRVISVFGAMFAPRHERTAHELLRVTRPGGTLALTTWEPDDLMGRMIGATATFLPVPDEADPPARWGDPEHIRQLLAGAAEVSIEPDTLTLADESVEHYLSTLQTSLGPVVAVRAAAEAAGRLDEAEAFLRDLHTGANTATDGSMSIDVGYLHVLARA